MTSQERLILAPAGRLGLTFAIAEDGGARVSIITHGSPLLGKLGVGEILVSVDGQDTSKLTPPELASLLKERAARERRLVVRAPPPPRPAPAPARTTR